MFGLGGAPLFSMALGQGDKRRAEDLAVASVQRTNRV